MSDLVLVEGLEPYFRLTANSIEIIERPSLEAFESLAYNLKIGRDVLRWLVGGWAVLLNDIHGPDAYEKLAEQCFGGQYMGQTIETFATVYRRVPIENRRDDLSWSHHRAVAALDWEQQRETLEYAAKEGLSVRQLMEHKSKLLGFLPPGTLQDQKFELEQQNHDLELEVQEYRSRLARIGSQVARIENALRNPNPDSFVKIIREAVSQIREMLDV